MTAIDSTEVKGEAGTGYEGPQGGPFNCGNCRYFNGTCGQSTMMKLSKLPRAEGGRVQVQPGGCCEYVDRKANTSAQRSFFPARRARGLTAPSIGSAPSAPPGVAP